MQRKDARTGHSESRSGNLRLAPGQCAPVGVNFQPNLYANEGQLKNTTACEREIGRETGSGWVQVLSHVPGIGGPASVFEVWGQRERQSKLAVIRCV